MFKRISTGQKLSILTAILTLLAFLTISFLSANFAQRSAKEQAEIIASLNSQYNSAVIEEKFNEIQTIGTNLAIEMETMIQRDEASRDMVIDTMENMLDEYENLFGLAITYEPNKFDGQDEKYKGSEGSDENGRFMPYVVRKNHNEYVTELCIYDYYDEEQMHWYNMPKTTKQTFLTEPTTYPVQGVPANMASIATPIMRDGEFVGVVSIDTSLSHIQEVIEKNGPPNGCAEVISTDGILVASSLNKDLISQSVYEDYNWENTLNNLQNNGTFNNIEYIDSLNTDVLDVYSKIKIKNSDQIWGYVTVIPLETVYEGYQDTSNLILLSGFILLAILIYINYTLIVKDL